MSRQGRAIELLEDWREHPVDCPGHPPMTEQGAHGLDSFEVLQLIDGIDPFFRKSPLEEALKRITTHNGEPVSVKNLRYAATHEALCRSWIFDVLQGLADQIEGTR